MQSKLTTNIDRTNYQFTSAVKKQLRDLEKFSDSALEWLMMEHYQFSSRNTVFLLTATNTTKQFIKKGVSEELQRNFNEEKNHAAIYKKSLLEIGTDVEKRIEFYPTSEFFTTILNLISTCASCTLGAMYATETAAIFEHEVFLDISHAVIERRKLPWMNSRLKAFHDMHLNGVEQGHKDGLGMFIDLATDNEERLDKVSQHQIRKSQVLLGANQAIHAMIVWWRALIQRAEKISV